MAMAGACSLRGKPSVGAPTSGCIIPVPSLGRSLAVRLGVAGDADFLRDVYIAGRWEEMAVTGWPAEAIQSFLVDQYRMQRRHYDGHYTGLERWIIRRQGENIGKILLLDTAQALRIVDIGLLPLHRGGGIGTALINWAKDLAVASGHGVVDLHVAPANPARRLYLRLGFHGMEGGGVDERLEWRSVEGR